MSSHPDWYEMIQQLTSLLLHDSTVVLLEFSLEGGVGPINTSSAEKHFVKHVTIYLFQLHQEAVKTLIWQFPNFKHSDRMTFQVLEQQNKTIFFENRMGKQKLY